MPASSLRNNKMKRTCAFDDATLAQVNRARPPLLRQTAPQVVLVSYTVPKRPSLSFGHRGINAPLFLKIALSG